MADAAEAERLISPLQAALAAGDVASLLLQLRQDGDVLLRGTSQVLAPVVQSKDVAFLIEGHAISVSAVGADGIHLLNGGDFADARRQLGANVSIGVTCHSRDDAISAGEQGADYVAFGDFDDPAPTPTTLALVEWWSELMTVPCVAAGGATSDSCRPLIEAGADFLALAGAAWTGPNGTDFVRGIMQAIAAAQISRR